MFEKIGENYNCLIHLFTNFLSYCSPQHFSKSNGKIPKTAKIIYLKHPRITAKKSFSTNKRIQ